jgi:cysteine-rich repeat protein
MRGGGRVGVGAVVCVLAAAVPARAADGLLPAGVATYGAFDQSGPSPTWDVATSPDGRSVYVTDRNNGTLVVFVRDASTGAVTVLQTLRDGVPPSPGLGPADGLTSPAGVAVSPDGKQVYVVAGEGTIATFARDPADGALQFVEVEREGVAGVSGLVDPFAPTVSPDGRHVYVLDPTASTLATFLRDALTGALGFVQVLADQAPTDALAGALDAAVSPDGRHLYVAANQDEAIGVFARDATASALTLVEAQMGGVAGVNGDRLGFPTAVVVSPDGHHVYASGDGSIVAYARDPQTGRLTVLGGALGPSEGIDGPVRALALGRRGDALYAATSGDGMDAVVMYRRDAVTGLLAFVVRHPGVFQPDALAVSPDDRFLYVAGDHAVTVFRRILCGDTLVDAGEQCDDGNALDGDCCSAACLLDVAGAHCADDGNGCTAEACDGAGQCRHTPTPGHACADDADPCTHDACSADARCEHFGVPADDCTPASPGRALLSLARPSPSRRILKWQWRGAGAPNFGDPTDSTGYTLCVFGERAGEFEVALSASLPAGGRCGKRACWKRKRRAFRYLDGAGARSGITEVGLAGAAHRTTLTVSGRPPRFTLPSLPVPHDQRVTVQLRRSDTRACWSAGFAGSPRSSARKFRATSD